MSNGITPAPAKPIEWTHVFHVCVTVIGMLGAAWMNSGKVTPGPLPQPNPPTPSPEPEPQPTPTPILPVAVTDMHLNNHGNTVDPGVMFNVKSDAGTTLTAIPSCEKDADFFNVADNWIGATLRNDCKLTVVVTGKEKPKIAVVTCRAPQPPPVPKPVIPDPPPKPTPPIPVTTGVRVVMLFDAVGAQTKDQTNAIHSPKVIALLNSKCVKDTAGRPAWHTWDKDATAPAEWAGLMTASLSQVKSQTLKLPVLCIEAGQKLTLLEITNEASTLAALNSAMGS